MNFSLSIVVLALLSLGFFGCGSKPAGTNITLSNQDATAGLDSRLQKSTWIKQHFDSLRSGLDPTSTIFADAASSAIHNQSWKLSADDSQRVSQILLAIPSRLDSVLREGGAGLADLGISGQWKVERDLPLDLGRADYHCPTSRVTVYGIDAADGSSAFRLTLSDCQTGGELSLISGEFDPVTSADGSSSGSSNGASNGNGAEWKTSLTLYPANLGSLTVADAKEGACSAQATTDGMTFHCDPVQIVQIPGAGFTIGIDNLDFKSDPNGVKGTVSMSASDSSGSQLWQWSDQYPAVGSKGP